MAQISQALDLWINTHEILLVSGPLDWQQSYPKLAYPWSPFLLSSIVAKFLPAYRVIGRIDPRYATHAIVRRDSLLHSREDVAVWLLRRQFIHGIELQELQSFLLGTGLYVRQVAKALMDDSRLVFDDAGLCQVVCEAVEEE